MNDMDLVENGNDQFFQENLLDRKVLVIAYYFPPMGLSGVQRTLKFVKYLPNYHWKPVVLTTGATDFYAFDDTLLNDINENILIYRTEKDPRKSFKIKKDGKNNVINYPSRFKQILMRRLSQAILIPDSRIGWKKHAVELGSKIIEENSDIKVIYTTAPPYTDFLVAKELSVKYNIPFVVDYRDLWVDNAYYYYATPFHKAKAIKMESDVLRLAQKAFVITRSLKEKMLRRYKFLSHNDIAILPHGFDEEDFIPYKHIKPNENKFTITHSGIFSEDLTPKYFLKALAKFLEQRKDAKHCIDVRFIGVMRKSHLKMINKLQLSDCTTITGYVSHDEVIKNLMESDLLWMMIPNDIATPSRLYEYIGARKPMIVCAPEGGIRQIAKESNVAITCGPKDVDAILNALNMFFDLWKANNMPKADKKYVNQYERKYITGYLAKELSLASNL